MISWDGREWERHATRLLRIRHGGNNLVEVPDAHKGDYGLECFTFDGYAFQCYAPEEPLTTDERYKRQRGKINDDIKKFLANHGPLAQILQSTIIHQWVLVTPKYDSAELARYCGDKAEEVRAAGLPYVSPTFHIVVHSKETYRYEEQILLGAALQHLSVSVPTIPDDSARDWLNSNSEHTHTLSAKMPVNFHGRLATLVKRYLEREYILNHLREDYPDLYSRVQDLCTAQENTLLTEQALPSDTTNLPLQHHLDQLRTNLRAECGFLTAHQAAAITNGSATEWLLQCSLNFANNYDQ